MIIAMAVIGTISISLVGAAHTTAFDVGGHVYYPNATIVSGADVNVTDLTTGESLTTTTCSNGAYVVALGNLPSGHSAGDTIQVTATYNGMTGTSSAPRSADSPQIIDVTIVPPTVITDTDGDGVPDVWDADNSTPAGYWVNSDGIGRMWGDMNGDGRLTSVDALMILQMAVGRHPAPPTRGGSGGGSRV